jgi:cell fate (sporulation/competence/biofilm development) regulator YlbF (YheA/YmcA/DUF963 family)
MLSLFVCLVHEIKTLCEAFMRHEEELSRVFSDAERAISSALSRG